MPEAKRTTTAIRAVPLPDKRRLRIFAVDPLVSPLDDPVVTVEVDWEPLRPGPQGRLVQVVDYDASARCWYAPVDLEDRAVIARDGLDPSEADPRFHQQMVYAVVMGLEARLRRALGRYVPLHGARRSQGAVQPLRVHPHGLREPNAYYSGAEHALVFGYFQASRAQAGRNLPGGAVFTCLSHDVVAHEATHGALHGLRPHFMEPTGPDVFAFHEAFADLVAVLHRFSLPGFLERAIRRSHARLDSADPLFDMGRQFGEALGERAALRSAVGPEADPRALERATECHARGAILLAAVFRALVAVYQRRTADLLRIATGGSGVLPPGDLAPDLVGRLAAEARKTATHFLDICIRAIDYCPPVDIDFGDYLRALITADRDLVPQDPWGYRAALIDAFRAWGIYPRDVFSLAEDSLVWRRPEAKLATDRAGFARIRFDRSPQEAPTEQDQRRYYQVLHAFLTRTNDPRAFQLSPSHKVQIASVQPLRRIGPDGRVRNEVVVQAVQRDAAAARGTGLRALLGGVTLVVEECGEVRYCVYKRVASRTRTARQRAWLSELIAAHERGDRLDGRGGLDEARILADARSFRMLHRGW